MKYEFNGCGVCINPTIIWQGIYNTYGGKNKVNPLFGCSYISTAKRGKTWFFGYSIGTQDWMHIAGCGKSNGSYISEKEAIIACLTTMLRLAAEQMTNYFPSDEEKSRLRSLITDLKTELVKHRQLSLF